MKYTHNDFYKNVKKDKLVDTSLTFFKTEKGKYAIIGFVVGIFFGAIPLLLYLFPLFLAIHFLIKYRGGKNKKSKKK